MRRYSFRSGILLTVLVLILTVAVLEVVVRPIIDPRVDFKNKPYSAYTYVQREYSMRVRLNADGFRDEPFEEPPAGAFRAVVLGDSFAFGWGVEAWEAFPQLLESLVSERLGRLAVFFNLSTEGSDVEEYVSHLRRLGPTLKPHLVVVSYFVGNDAVARRERVKRYPESLSEWVEKYLKKLKLVRIIRTRRLKSQVAQSLGMDLQPRDVRGVRNPMLDLLSSADPAVQARLRRVPEEDLKDALQWRINPFSLEQAVLQPDLAGHLKGQLTILTDDPSTGRLLKDIRDEAARLGATVACVLIPASFQVQPSAVAALKRLGYKAEGELVAEPRPQRVLVEILRELDVPTLDLTVALRGLPEEPYYPLDGHLNPAGHRAVALAIAGFLAENGLLADESKES